MKTTFALIAAFTLGFFLGARQTPNNHDLEIYTSTDIYYIDGLRVTTETGEYDITFENKEELKEFLSDRTSKEVKNIVNY